MPNSARRAFTLLEGMILITSVVLVTWLGGMFHRRLSEAAGLHGHHASIEELTTMIRSMPYQAKAKRQTLELRMDASRRNFQLIAIEQRRDGAVELVERTVWLPSDLEVLEAPSAVTALPTGKVSPVLIVITAPSENRLFRLTMTAGGLVQLHEEPTS